jgi:hypothetical protein
MPEKCLLHVSLYYSEVGELSWFVRGDVAPEPIMMGRVKASDHESLRRLTHTVSDLIEVARMHYEETFPF